MLQDTSLWNWRCNHNVLYCNAQLTHVNIKTAIYYFHSLKGRVVHIWCHTKMAIFQPAIPLCHTVATLNLNHMPFPFCDVLVKILCHCHFDKLWMFNFDNVYLFIFPFDDQSLPLTFGWFRCYCWLYLDFFFDLYVHWWTSNFSEFYVIDQYYLLFLICKNSNIF